MNVSLRTFVFIDSLQPQLASYLATSSQGFLPVPGDACVWIEVAPGMAVHRLSDIALKETNVHLGEQVVVRLIHPLAGKTIHIKSKILEVREPTPEEAAGQGQQS